MSEEKRGRGRPAGSGGNRYGSSPFSSPLGGDVLHAKKTGEMREVESRAGGIVTYFKDDEDDARTTTVGSWKVWCATNEAELVDSKVKR